MTKAPERGDNEFTEEAKRESARTGVPVCDILKGWIKKAKTARDRKRLRKLQQAEKFLGCRNRRKRGSSWRPSTPPIW